MNDPEIITGIVIEREMYRALIEVVRALVSSRTAVDPDDYIMVNARAVLAVAENLFSRKGETDNG